MSKASGAAIVLAGAPAPVRRRVTGSIAGGLIVLGVLLAGPLLVQSFIVYQLTMVLIYAIAILSLNLLTGATGQFALGHSAFFAAGAYATGILMEYANVPYALAILAAGALSFACGFLFGLPTLRLRGVYLALATFALALAAPPLLKLRALDPWTGGVQGLLVTKPNAPFGWQIDQDLWIYYLALLVAMVAYWLSVNLLRSRSGRALVAIRDNEVAAASMGIDVALYKTLTLGISAGLTGIAGGLGAIAVSFVSPDAYTFSLSVSLFLGMVIGGVGWLPGSLVGAAFIVYIPSIADSISQGLSGLVFGVFVFTMLLLLPGGAWQLVEKARRMRA